MLIEREIYGVLLTLRGFLIGSSCLLRSLKIFKVGPWRLKLCSLYTLFNAGLQILPLSNLGSLLRLNPDHIVDSD